VKDRLVIPEILDSLPHDDPDAMRARHDLRKVNFLMGNYRWVRRQVLGSGLQEWFELGAGEGRLSASSEFRAEKLTVTGVDFSPRPASWPEAWAWLQGDLFEALETGGDGESSGCIAVLFLHHFEKPALKRLGSLLEKRFVRLVVAEPARYRIFRFLAYALFPFVNSVTRHDMQVSIGAGFGLGELEASLDLGPDWMITESVHWLGGYRFDARKKGE